MPSAKKFSFSAKLESVDGVLADAVIFLPEEIIKKLPKGRLRVKGTFNNTPFALGIQYKKDGRRFFVVSHVLRKAGRFTKGATIQVVFHLVDSDQVDLPEELEAVLEQDEEAKNAWNKISPGLQRGLIHYITSTKNVDLRIKRSIQLMERARMGTLHPQTKKKKSKED